MEDTIEAMVRAEVDRREALQGMKEAAEERKAAARGARNARELAVLVAVGTAVAVAIAGGLDEWAPVSRLEAYGRWCAVAASNAITIMALLVLSAAREGRSEGRADGPEPRESSASGSTARG